MILMKTFSINTLGCKVNQYEGRQIREFLEQLGLNQAQKPEKADFFVVNTCCVTHTASARCRQYIRKARKLNPQAVIVVSGCLPTVQIDELELNEPADNVHLIKNRSNLAAVLSQIVNPKAASSDSRSHQTRPESAIKAQNGRKIKSKNELCSGISLPTLTSFKGQTRAFLKVQDGCDGYCSYCIVPKTRPFVHSRPVEEVLSEAKTLVEAGHREIVVTGIYLGSYGQKTVRRKNWANQRNDKLADLLDKMAQIPNLARIRLSSLEPGDVTPRLIETFLNHSNIMPHLHLSLQSASNAVLKKMCRQYNADEFREVVESIKLQLEKPAITTDIIVGFPGETDCHFEETVELAREVGFAKMHVFAFSARKGTAAAKLKDTVDNRVIKQRSQILRDLDIELGRKFREQFVGETAQILLENKGEKPYGRSERYFKVYLEKTTECIETNELVTVKLIKNRGDGMLGQTQ